MRTRLLIAVAALAMVSALGQGQPATSSPTTSPASQPATQAARPMPHGTLDYTVWQGAPVGAWARHVGTYTVDGKTTRREETLRVAEVAPRKITLKTTFITIDADGKQNKQEGTRGLEPSTFSPPREPGLDLTEGDEAVTLGDKRYKCHWYKLVRSRNGRSHTFQIWLSDEVAGRVVKQTGLETLTQPDGAVKTVETSESAVVESSPK